jgi:AraC-like DNA-binding protein
MTCAESLRSSTCASPDQPLKRVAELLGFEDQSNMFRACKRWFGQSPGQYRARFSMRGTHLVESPGDRPRGQPSRSRD